MDEQSRKIQRLTMEKLHQGENVNKLNKFHSVESSKEEMRKKSQQKISVKTPYQRKIL